MQSYRGVQESTVQKPREFRYVMLRNRNSFLEREYGTFVLKLLLSTSSNETLSKLARVVYLCYVPHEVGVAI